MTSLTFTLAPEAEEEPREAGRLLFAGPVTFVKGVVAMAGLPPAGRVEVWRERSFDFVQAGDWVSGTFDRVVLECDAQGRAMRGWILDFKTDEVPDEAALAAKLDGYQPQIALYVQALSGLTGLPVDAIRASLLLVRSQRIVDLLPR